jgi:hypothetical protein
MTKERLYEAFGELLYALAQVDGVVQPEELSKIKALLSPYRWGETVLWSFNYEHGKSGNMKDIYQKAFNCFAEYGAFAEFYELMEVLEKVAAASNGISIEERQLIDGFKHDLREVFLKKYS